MKYRCRCGHLFVDQTDGLPFKASTIPDQSIEAMFEAIDVLIKSQKPECVTEWDSMTDPITMPQGSREIYQCPQCGRVHISGAGYKMYSFLPEDDHVPKNLMSNES